MQLERRDGGAPLFKSNPAGISKSTYRSLLAKGKSRRQGINLRAPKGATRTSNLLPIMIGIGRLADTSSTRQVTSNCYSGGAGCRGKPWIRIHSLPQCGEATGRGSATQF